MHAIARSQRQGRAVVLGASLAGLLAARVLSERFAEVVLLERDLLADRPSARKGTPHAVHPHGLLARGLEVLEELFPGFTASMVERGGTVGDLMSGCGFYADRQRFAQAEAGRPALAASRLLIEHEIRRRVLALPGVRLVAGVDVQAPRLDGSAVVAARWCERAAADAPPRDTQELAADLVVDCTGRGSRTPAWLRGWGFPEPADERVELGICYTSAYFARSGACAMGPGLDWVAEFGAVTNRQPRPGVVIAQEPLADGEPRWVVSVGGFAGDHPEPTLQAMRERAADIGSPMLERITREGRIIGEVMRYRIAHSRRLRYEALKRFPAGLLVMGDALTSFNPIYGQGMTVAACQALALRAELAAAPPQACPLLARRFFRAAGRVIDIPWQLAVGGDLSIDAVPGPRPLPVRLVNAYIGRLYRVAPFDAQVSAAFQKVVHMIAPAQSLFAPAIVWRVLRGPGAAGRAAAPRAPMPAVAPVARSPNV